MNTIQVGQTVRFRAGKQPLSAEHKLMAARRASNMSEHLRFQEEAKNIVWEDLYACDVVYKVDGEYVWVGNINDNYRLRISEVTVIS